MGQASDFIVSEVERKLNELANERYEKETRLLRMTLEVRYGALGSALADGFMTFEEVMSGLVSDIKRICDLENLFKQRIAELAPR